MTDLALRIRGIIRMVVLVELIVPSQISYRFKSLDSKVSIGKKGLVNLIFRLHLKPVIQSNLRLSLIFLVKDFLKWCFQKSYTSRIFEQCSTYYWIYAAFCVLIKHPSNFNFINHETDDKTWSRQRPHLREGPVA